MIEDKRAPAMTRLLTLAGASGSGKTHLALEVARRNFYETLLKTQSDLREGLFVVEREHIIYANEAFCEISGYSMADLADLPSVLDLAASEERSVLEDRLRRRLRGQAVEERYESAIRHASGRRVEVEVAVRMLQRGDRVAQLVALVRDITGRKQAEERAESNMAALLALHEAGRVLTSTLELEEIGKRLLEVVRRVCSLEGAILYLRAEDESLSTLGALGQESLRHAASGAPEVEGARRAALDTKDSQLFQASWSEAESSPLVGLCLPLRVQNRTIGLLEVYGEDETVDDETIEVFESLASQAASALENARLYRAVTEREGQLKELVGELLVAQEQERRRVAHEVHDGLTQVAIGTHLSLQAFADDHPPATATGAKKLNRVLQLARQTVREARRVIVDLRPPTLDDFGLAAALRLKVEALRVDGWRIRYDETLGEERLPTDLETALYRVVQEALTNVRKHALTRNVLITLRRQENNVRLDVRDEGCGFDRHEASERVDLGEHVGLSSMQERIALLGGKCWIYSRPGAGTSLAAEVPLLGSGEVGDEHEC